MRVRCDVGSYGGGDVRCFKVVRIWDFFFQASARRSGIYQGVYSGALGKSGGRYLESWVWGFGWRISFFCNLVRFGHPFFVFFQLEGGVELCGTRETEMEWNVYGHVAG